MVKENTMGFVAVRCSEGHMAFTSLVKKLNDYLRPIHTDTIHTDIFEKTLLLLAGVKTKPTFCRFDAQFHGSTLDFTIKGLSSDKAESFLGYLEATCKDPNASMSYTEPADTLTGIWATLWTHDLTGYDVHHFHVDAKLAEQYLFKAFKDVVEKMRLDAPETLEPYRVSDDELAPAKPRRYLVKGPNFST